VSGDGVHKDAVTRVLVIDDEPPIRLLCRVNLEAEGMEVLEAWDGPGGLEQARAERPDVILLDVMMPGLDGFDTMRIIRQLDAYKQLPIVAVTAKAMAGDRERCLEAGANDYIAKPVNVDVLLATLWRALQATTDA
jgi:CheY-like chemotaxis protein